ncbi:hypothetical protein V1477_018428 [Vespula maculifrons]|uniref:Uncharacterized protein n=1 Tax=Vespula maculifrons TaxID=7453 RepID=A0ABD2AW91_VESMC
MTWPTTWKELSRINLRGNSKETICLNHNLLRVNGIFGVRITGTQSLIGWAEGIKFCRSTRNFVYFARACKVRVSFLLRKSLYITKIVVVTIFVAGCQKATEASVGDGSYSEATTTAVQAALDLFMATLTAQIDQSKRSKKMTRMVARSRIIDAQGFARRVLAHLGRSYFVGDTTIVLVTVSAVVPPPLPLQPSSDFFPPPSELPPNAAVAAGGHSGCRDCNIGQRLHSCFKLDLLKSFRRTMPTGAN